MRTETTSLRCETRVVHVTAMAAYPPYRTLARYTGSCMMTRCDAVKSLNVGITWDTVEVLGVADVVG